MKRILFFILIVVRMAFAQGSLTPPMGGPAPSMKSLSELNSDLVFVSNQVDQLEVRVDLQTLRNKDPDALFTITQPGSYYLGASVAYQSTNQYLIKVLASNVHIDLNGHYLARIFSQGTTYGIFIDSTRSGVCIENGSIRGSTFGVWNEGGQPTFTHLVVESAQATGVVSKVSSLVSFCIFRNNSGSGLVVGDNSLVQNSLSIHNAGNGIETGSGCVVTHCIVSDNTQDGIHLGDASIVAICKSNQSGEEGVEIAGLSIISDTVATGSSENGLQIGSGSIVGRSLASQNTLIGFWAGQGCLLHDCMADRNGGGIRCDESGNLASCVVLHSGAGANALTIGSGSLVRDSVSSYSASTMGSGLYAGYASLLLRNKIEKNKNRGLYIGSLSFVKDCEVSGNGSNGIDFFGKSYFLNNQVQENTALGFKTTVSDSRIEKNQVLNNNDGIVVTHEGNFLVKNSSSGNTNSNYSITGTQTIGTIYKTGSFVLPPLNPWANFEQ